MSSDYTLCKGEKCNERESCNRFVKGKTEKFGWWIAGKNSPYESCECRDAIEEAA